MQKKYRRFLTLLAFIFVVSSTIAYSALTTSLNLTAEAKLRTVSDIRVTDIKYSSTSGGTLQYESTQVQVEEHYNMKVHMMLIL